MAHELHTEIEIDASPETVWAIVTDLPRYAEILSESGMDSAESGDRTARS